MTKKDFNEWIIKNTPQGVEMDDFEFRLASGCIALIQHVSETSSMSISEIVERFYYPVDGYVSPNS